MLIFAPSEMYTYTYICCIYVYTHMYIVTNFMEKRNSKFKSNLMIVLNVCYGFSVLLFMSQYFSYRSRFSFGIYIHLTHYSQSNVVIFIETYNSKRTKSSDMHLSLVTR
jgi:hypothetical protein